MTKENRARRNDVRRALQTLPTLADIHRFGDKGARLVWRSSYRKVRTLAHVWGTAFAYSADDAPHRAATLALLVREGYSSLAVTGYEKLAMGSPFMRNRLNRHFSYRGKLQPRVDYPYFAEVAA